MQYAKKYTLVPEESLSKHTPSPKQLSELDKEMSSVLNSSMNEYEKVQRYYEILQKKMNLENFNLPWTSTVEKQEEREQQHQHSDKKPTIKEEDYSSIILNSVPTSFKRQAGTLLQLMGNRPDIIKWNDRGELFHRGQSLPNSNIADLFNLIFTNRKSVDVIGKTDFLKALKELNIPRYYIKNKNVMLPIKQEILTENKNIIKEELNPPSPKKRRMINVKSWESL